MARPNGFSMVLDTVNRPRMCDVCTSQQSDAWLMSFVGEIPQSDLCIDCARDAAKLLAPDRMAAARAAKAEKALLRSNSANAEAVAV